MYMECTMKFYNNSNQNAVEYQQQIVNPRALYKMVLKIENTQNV